MVPAGSDRADVGQVRVVVRNLQGAADVEQLLLGPLHQSRALEDEFGRRLGGPGEVRFRVDLVRAADDPVLCLSKVDRLYRSCGDIYYKNKNVFLFSSVNISIPTVARRWKPQQHQQKTITKPQQH